MYRYYDRERGLTGYYVNNTDSADQIVTLQEVKDMLVVSGNADDNLLTSMIISAREVIESYIDKSLLTQTWTLFLNDYPRCDDIPLPRSPLQTVTSVKSYDDDNTATTFASSNYFVDIYGSAIVLNRGVSFPSITLRPRNGVEIIYVSGYGTDISDVPDEIRTAVMMAVNAMYDGCEQPITPQVAALLMSHKRIEI